MRFANPDKGPLGQLFGDYLTGLKRMRIIGGASELGFRSAYKRKGDPTELKQEWACALRTEKNWVKLGHCITRVIKGVRFIIQEDPQNPGQFYVVEKFRGKQFTNTFSSYESGKRFVRKLTNKTQTKLI